MKIPQYLENVNQTNCHIKNHNPHIPQKIKCYINDC
jgi:hypothetical protein